METTRQEALPAAARASSSSETSLPSRGRRSTGGAARLSLLVAKLEAYEQQSKQPPSLPASPPPPRGFVLPPAPERAGRFVTPMPTPGTAALRAWADDTGAQLARTLRPAMDEANAAVSAKRVQQTVQTDTPERIEVHNVFNVEVHTQGGAADKTLANLSEKIADILREQAIQHGIDLS